MKLLQVGCLVALFLVALHPLLAQEATPEVTADMPLPEPTATLGGVPLQFISSQATYQNRLPDNAGINIQILDNDLKLLGTAVTDAQGVYTVATPIDAFYWLVATAPLHRQQTLPIQPGSAVPNLILMGGDLNQDACIGLSDVQQVVAQLDLVGASASDITGDGVTDVADLAIVTGNYDPACEAPPTIEATEEATAEVTAEATVEVTAESTAESTAEATAEVTAEATAEVTAEVTLEVTAEMTAEATAESTAEVSEEATAEVTEAVTPEATVEITAEMTAEVTAEATVELTVEMTAEVTAEATAEVVEQIEEITPEVTAVPTVEAVTPEATSEPLLAEITDEPTATYTLEPTATAQPTATMIPSVTPIPTQTPIPSVTFTSIPAVTEETTVEATAAEA